jgi:hypothetical protein
MPTAQNLTESALNMAQSKISEMFPADTPAKYAYKRHHGTAMPFLGNNQARTTPIMQGDNCVGQQIVWTDKGADTVDLDGTAAEMVADMSCDLSDGEGAVSDDTSYTNNVGIKSVIRVNDDECGDNVIKAADLMVERVQAAFADLHAKLNTRAINFLNTNRTANKSTIYADGLQVENFTYSAADKHFSAPRGEMDDARILYEMKRIAELNDLSNYFIMSGLNMDKAFGTAAYTALNDNERSQSFFDTERLYFDQRDLDRTLDAASGIWSTFAVGEGTYAVWNSFWGDRVPNQISDNKWEYFIEDPDLMIMENGVMRPVRYQVLYQKICYAISATGKRKFKHLWEIKYLGGLYAAPVGESSETGIVKFVSELAS